MSSCESTYIPYNSKARSVIVDIATYSDAAIHHGKMCATGWYDLSITKNMIRWRYTCALITVHDLGGRFTKIEFDFLFMGYAVASQSTSLDCCPRILRTSCFGVLVLTCKYAYVNV